MTTSPVPSECRSQKQVFSNTSHSSNTPPMQCTHFRFFNLEPKVWIRQTGQYILHEYDSSRLYHCHTDLDFRKWNKNKILPDYSLELHRRGNRYQMRFYFEIPPSSVRPCRNTPEWSDWSPVYSIILSRIQTGSRRTIRGCHFWQKLPLGQISANHA